jgi:hypothetical protein
MKRANAWKVLVVALVVLVVAAALVVPVVAGAVAVGRPTAGDGSTAAVYPGHIKWPGYECQSGHACGGVIIAEITPTPVPIDPDAVCQSGHACGG